MRFKLWTYIRWSNICFIISILLFLLSLAGNISSSRTDYAAVSMSKRIEARLSILDKAIEKTDDHSEGKRIFIKTLPDDMVIYCYVNDSLKSWQNQFSILNDNISAKLEIQRITNHKSRIVSPLKDITEELTFINLGPKWYLVKCVEKSSKEKIIAGLEIQNSIISDSHDSENGVNPHLRLSDRFKVLPLNYCEGSPVMVSGKPTFKISYNVDSLSGPFNYSLLRWIALIFLAAAFVLHLAHHRTLRAYFIVNTALLVIYIIAFKWGKNMIGISPLFSPSLYADGAVLFALGSLLLTNTYITLFNSCIYLIRRLIISHIRQAGGNLILKKAIFGVIIIGLAIVNIGYYHYSLHSLIQNSGLTLELYRWNTQFLYTAMVYFSYSGLFISILLLLQMLRPVVWKFFNLKYNLFSHKGLAITSLIWALYMSITAGTMGLQKEQDRVQVWANRLAVDRDLTMEIQLRTVEENISNDPVLQILAYQKNSHEIIKNRIAEYYLSNIRQAYRLNVLLISDADHHAMSYFEGLIQNGSPIANGSRFLFVSDNKGRQLYAGLFVFFSKDKGATHMIVEIEPDNMMDDKGYFSFLRNRSKLGSVNIPPVYSFAKYDYNRLTSYKGNYPYPTSIPKNEELSPEGKRQSRIREKGYIHFHHDISDEETIIISRPTRTFMIHFTSFSYLTLFLLLIMQVLVRGRKTKHFRSNYFRRKINIILFISSCLILASMAIISVVFVYKRNEANMFNLMSSKISTIQALIENQTRNAYSWHDLISAEFANEIENISITTKSDISFYTTEGKIFRSTSPEVFEKMIIGSRIDPEAYHNIYELNNRFYINKSEVAGVRLWTLYAPIFNSNGELITIISTPYTDRNFDFQVEALFHAAMIINIFLLLLIGSLIFSTKEVNSMFSPLIEMGNKMKSADLKHLEYITYKREDEISSLVEAYNRMVKDLSDSSRQLAQAERDYAWSQMARQVAHEIKNPLTPIKLELQRLIRLKEKNHPAWEEKFDKISGVILEHIDILTDTANEFSTFAKLYSEKPSVLDLDKILKDQLLIFDNKENITISYIGMEDAVVMAPKPQLIRVFVNLITNAIQAVEIQRREVLEKGGNPEEGKILIFLRKSTREGYYDVVVDDNGPGVTEENLNKLFTPNFTTKSGGTGLGLAICRNIVEKCNGEISYQKSFALGGASFTVTIPMKQDA